MIQKASDLLTALGLETPGDDPVLQFVAESVGQTIRNETGCPDIPEGLIPWGARRIAGEYLRLNLGAGKLAGGQAAAILDAAPAIKELREGDTTVVYAIGEDQSPQQRLSALITSLLGDERELHRYRRLIW